MEKYNPSKIEKKWQKYWEKHAELSRAEEKSRKSKFYCLDMFPYPSGDGLHVGHVEGYTASDIYSRYLRMNGKNVLHPMGWDAFGLPAENYAIKSGVHPEKSTKQNIKNFTRQIKSMGFSYDWLREIDTSHPDYYKWTQWFFLFLYKNKLAYRKKAKVNWCESCKTVLANEQVEDGVCERCKNEVSQKEMEQWFFRITDFAEYLIKGLEKIDWPESTKIAQKNWIGKSEGAIIKFQITNSKLQIKSKPQSLIDQNFLEVFTTRLDTIYGCTYCVVAPEHEIIERLKTEIKNFKIIEKYVAQAKKKTDLQRTELQKEKTGVEIKGVKAVNPFTNEEVPIFVADYVLSTYGTGAVMAVPAHDERDFEFAKKYNLPIKQAVAPYFALKGRPDSVRKDKKIVKRKTVYAFLKHHKENKFLCLDWKPFGWHSGIIGGVKDDESYEEAARREIIEETGYKNMRFIREIGGEVHNFFFAAHKDINRYAFGKNLLFELENEENGGIEEEHAKNHKTIWIDEKGMEHFLNLTSFEYAWKLLKGEKECFVDDGIVVNSAEFSDMSSEKGRVEMVKWLEKKNLGGPKTTYKLRDWLISRQRYWGAPIPMIYCEKCGWQPVPEKDLPVILPEVKDYRPKGTSPLGTNPEFVNTKCPKCKGQARRETDTMDTSSAQAGIISVLLILKTKKNLRRAKKSRNGCRLISISAERNIRFCISCIRDFSQKLSINTNILVSTNHSQNSAIRGLCLRKTGARCRSHLET